MHKPLKPVKLKLLVIDKLPYPTAFGQQDKRTIGEDIARFLGEATSAETWC